MANNSDRKIIYGVDLATEPDATAVMVYSMSADGTLSIEDFEEVANEERMRAYLESWQDG